MFRVGNMIGVGFLNSNGKAVNITDPDHRPDDITYFTFRTTVNPHLVDTRAPNSVHLFEFSLRLPNTSPSLSASRLLRDSIQPNTTPAPVDTFDSILENLTDNNLQFMSATRMRKLLSARHNTLNASRSLDTSRILEFTTPPPSATSMASIKTPKMDMICSTSPVGCTYTETLDFLDDQQSFDNIFGHNPVMLIISARSSRAVEDSETIRSKILELCCLSHLHIFCDNVQLQYVGTTPYDSNQMVLNISLALSTLKLDYRYKEELTIAKHSDPVPSVDSSSKPLVVKKDGQSYPRNPTNGYISRYPSNFFGCLGCGAVDHLFKECQHNRVSTVRSLYWQELWAHVPKTRKKISHPFDPPNTDSVNTVSSHQKPMPIAILTTLCLLLKC